MSTVNRPLPTPALPFEQGLAEQAWLISNSADLYSLALREFHAIGYVHGTWSAGAIGDHARDHAARDMQAIARRRRESLLALAEHAGRAERRAILREQADAAIVQVWT